MLQQARLVTVNMYVNRFVHRWPTARALAKAPVAEVVRESAGAEPETRSGATVRGGVCGTAS